MKNAIVTLASLLIFILPSFTQESSIKNYPLRDYIAPEIKYREFEFNTWLYSGGDDNFLDQNKYAFQLNAGLKYYEYKNTMKHQGITDASFRTSFSAQGSKEDSIKNNSTRFQFGLDYSTQNRIYFRDDIFLGVHGDFSYNIVPLSDHTGEYKTKYQYQNLYFTPYISVGKGRIQPVESARRSVDILLALQESNRLAVSPDQTMIDSLAKLANQIRYKRFYDKRFKTIYQLEELDKAIQDLGLVDSLDIVYFANLNDIWNYAPAYRRGSGTRIEAGIIPDISYHYNKYDHEEMSRISTSHDNHYGIYGFFSINRLRPVNYTWQSDLMIDLTFGYMQGIYKYEEDDDNTYELKSENFNSLLNASWQFGYYPNTRTFAGLTPYVGVSNDQDFELDKNTFGVNTGLRFESYYYLSPRLRLSAWARISYYDNFANSMPTPFWNTVSYSQTVFNTYKQVTDAVAFPITALSDNKKKIEYSAFFSLTYAIF